MQRFNLARLVRTCWLLAVCGALVSPSLATSQATEVRPRVATIEAQHPVADPSTRALPGFDAVPAARSEGGAGAEKPVILAQASDLGVSGFFTSGRASAEHGSTGAAGFPLPEPGPISAIIATLALALFFFVRRTS